MSHNLCAADVGGQHCPCPVLVSFLSGKSCPMSVCCLDSVRCSNSVRIIEKSYPLSVCPDKDETELSGLSLSLSVDVYFLIIMSEMSQCDPKTLEIGFVVADR